MPRKSATKTTTETAVKAAKKTTAGKASKSTKAKKVVEAAPAKVEAVAETVAPEVTQEQQLSSEFTNILSVIGTLTSQLSALKTQVRALEKKAVRELKAANKANKKRSKSKGNRQPSGFVKPTPISGELAKFLGKSAGTEMARTEVTKEINAYIRSNSLQDPSNGRVIIPDAKLRALLVVPEGEQLTYFNLQRYMSRHFQKASKSSSKSA